PAPVSLVYLSSGPAILGCPLIWRQGPVGNDVLTNVAIVVMRLVGLAPASVEQRDTRRNASSVGRLSLLAMATSVLMAVMVCARARALTSATSFGLPPGLPLWPFWNVPGLLT